MHDVHERGLGPVLERLAAVEGRWLVTIDCDGLDPWIAPGVGWPEPGGLTFMQIASIVRSLAHASEIAALDITER